MSEIEGDEAGRSNEPSDGSSKLDDLEKLSGFFRDSARRFLEEGGDGALDPARLADPMGLPNELLTLLREFVPAGVSVDRWRVWLAGVEPLKGKDLPKRPGAKTLSNPAILRDRRDALANVNADIDALEQKLAAAKEKRRQFEAMAKSNLQYVLLRRVAEFMGGVFAMGPAWTVMRSIAFPVELPSALFERYDLEAFDDLQKLKAELGPRFLDSQAAIMRALYYMAGDPIFESRLHAALRRLADEFEDVIAGRAYGRTSVSLGKMDERDDDRARLAKLASVDATAPPEVIDEEEPI